MSVGKGWLEGTPLGDSWALEELEKGNWSRNVVLGNQGLRK